MASFSSQRGFDLALFGCLARSALRQLTGTKLARVCKSGPPVALCEWLRHGFEAGGIPSLFAIRKSRSFWLDRCLLGDEWNVLLMLAHMRRTAATGRWVTKDIAAHWLMPRRLTNRRERLCSLLRCLSV
ncbi:aminoglycoside adenylyltransferase domain-containing protein [Rhizobium sp. NPDC090279]|uniref:aminoglycoside adenylyltransferase domain-containing protein n=1 Tax=Rhizobium sp. NPDC090279 TaxID=3364499 RepID=UPI00383B4993